MPIIHIELVEGRTEEQKKNLMKKVTEAVCDAVNVTPDRVRIIVNTIKKSDYAVGGKLRSEE